MTGVCVMGGYHVRTEQKTKGRALGVTGHLVCSRNSSEVSRAGAKSMKWITDTMSEEWLGRGKRWSSLHNTLKGFVTHFKSSEFPLTWDTRGRFGEG